MRLFLHTAGRLALLAFIGVNLAGAQGALTLRQAIEQALGASPEAKLADAERSGAKAGAALARTQLYPQINFTEDISRGDDPVYVFGSKLRQQSFTQADFAVNSLNRPQPVGDFATRLSGSWLAFDSFKTQRTIRSADLMEKSAEASTRAMNQKIVLDVVDAYQEVLYAERQIAIAEHEQETADALLSSVNDHVRAGLAVESDRMSAQVNVAARKQELIVAQGGLEMAWAQLRAAMGDAHVEETKLEPIDAHEFPAGALNDELAAAFKMRPDLAALGQAQLAQAAAMSAARLDFGPHVNVYGNWEQDRPTFAGAGGNNWVAGVQVGIDLIPFSKRARFAKETAAKEHVDAQVSAYQRQIRLQVTQSHIQRQTAEQSLETARSALGQSDESLRILKNRYAAGLSTITDLLRAEDAERQSQTNYWQAVYGNAVAYAQLLFAQGALTPDAAEGLQ